MLMYNHEEAHAVAPDLTPADLHLAGANLNDTQMKLYPDSSQSSNDCINHFISSLQKVELMFI